MKKKNLNWALAALAAMALVFAGACSDDAGGDTYATYADEHTVTASQVEALLQSIGDEAVATGGGGTAYWLFASGSMSESAESVTAGDDPNTETATCYVFSVSATTGATTKADDVLTALAGLGLGEDGVLTLPGNPCYIDFSEIDSSDCWLGGAPDTTSTNTDPAYLKVEVQCADWYTLPDELGTILIKFTPDSSWTSA